ncbi:MAG: Gfo/Idh/MocA family protein [Bryobacteraceae bacterium]
MRIAVAGLGFMGSMHLKALRNIPGATLHAVVSSDPAKLAGDLSGIQGNLGGPGEKMDFTSVRKYTRVEEALADPDVDAIDICLPTHRHAEVATAALQAGKHVLVEKPLALDGAEADAVLAAAAASGRILMTAQVLRFFPDYLPLADLIRCNKLGPVRSALFRRRCAAPTWSAWLADASRSGGGVFDLLIHDVDICLHLFGAPEAVSATGHEDMQRGIDTITAQLHYPAIGSVTITGGWHHPQSYPFSMEYTVVAEEGTVDYSSAHRPPSLYRADGSEELLPVPEKDGYQAEIEYFLDCCRTGRKPAICPPEESAAAVKIARLMAEARNGKGETIPCKL